MCNGIPNLIQTPNLKRKLPTLIKSSNTSINSTNTAQTTTNQSNEPGLKIDEVNSTKKILTENILNGEKQHIEDTESLKLAAPINNKATIKYDDLLIVALKEKNENHAVEILKNNIVDINFQDENKNTALIMAIKKGDVDISLEIIKQPKLNINIQNNKGNTALMRAIFYEEKDITQEILKRDDVDINLQNKHGFTALLLAIYHNQTDIALEILKRDDINVNLQDYDSYTALMDTIRNDQKDIAIEILKRKGVDINLQNKHYFTALMLAIYHNQTDIALEILKRDDVDINFQNKHGFTALLLAIYHNQTDIALEILKRDDVNINLQDYNSYTALMGTISHDEKDVALEILKNPKVDVNLQNKNGFTALMLAINEKQTTIALEILKRDDVNVNLQDYDRHTALMGTISNDQKDVALEILEKENVNINIQNEIGMTVLMGASFTKEHTQILSKMLKTPYVNVNIQDNNGNTALMGANDDSGLEILKRDDVNINLQSNDGYTALMQSINSGTDKKTEEILKNKDVDVNLQNETGYTALMLSILKNKTDIALEILKNKEINMNLQDNDGHTALMWAIEKDQKTIAKSILERKDIEINQLNNQTHLSELETLYNSYKAKNLISTHYLLNRLIQHGNFFKNLTQNNLNIAAEFIIQNSNNNQILNYENSTITIGESHDYSNNDTNIQLSGLNKKLSEISKNKNLKANFIRCLNNEKSFWSLFKHLTENISEQKINIDWALAILMPYITKSTNSENTITQFQKIIAFERILFEKISSFEINKIVKEIISKINIKKTDCIKGITDNYKTKPENNIADEPLGNLTLKTNFTDAGILYLTKQQQQDNAKKIENYKNHKEAMNDTLNSLDNLYTTNKELTIIEIKQLNIITQKQLKELDRSQKIASNEINELTKLAKKRIPYETFLTNEYNELEKNIQKLTVKISQPSDLSINLYKTLNNSYNVQNLLRNAGVKVDLKQKVAEFNTIKNKVKNHYLSVEKFNANQDDISMLFYELNDHMSNRPSTDNVKDQETHFSEWIDIKKRLTTRVENLKEINVFHEDAIKYINEAIVKKGLSFLKNQPKLDSISEDNETTILSLKKPPIEALFESMDELGISISTNDTKSIVSSVSTAISIATSLDQKEGAARKQEINAIKTSIVEAIREKDFDALILNQRKKILGPITPYLRKLSGNNVDQKKITEILDDSKRLRKNDKLQYELTIRNNTPHGKGIEKSKKYHLDDNEKIKETHIHGLDRLNYAFKLFEIGEITLNHEKIEFLTTIFKDNMSKKESGSSHYSISGPLLIPDDVQILSSDLIYDRWIALKVFDEAFDKIKKTEAAKLKKAATQKSAQMP